MVASTELAADSSGLSLGAALSRVKGAFRRGEEATSRTFQVGCLMRNQHSSLARMGRSPSSCPPSRGTRGIQALGAPCSKTSHRKQLDAHHAAV